MSNDKCQVCGAWTDDGVVLASIGEWVHLCSALCRIAFAEAAPDYLGAALLRLGDELESVAPAEAWGEASLTAWSRAS